MLLLELFEADVLRFPDRPITLKIGRHQEPTFHRGRQDITGWSQVEYMNEDAFDNLIDRLLPVKDVFDEEEVDRIIMVVDDDVDRTAVVLLKDGRIAYEDTVGETHISDKPTNPQQLIAAIRSNQ